MRQLVIVFFLLLFCHEAFGGHKKLFTDRFNINVGANYTEAKALNGGDSGTNNSDIGKWIAVGFSPIETIGIQLEYTEFGEFSSSDSMNQDQNAKVDSLALSFVGRAFITNRFLAYASLGASHTNIENIGPEQNEPTTNDNEISARYGAGLEYFLYRELSVGVDFKRIDGDLFESNTTTLFFNYVF